MSRSIRCPMCDGGELVRSEGRLDQSGDTYIPTIVWSCPICEFASWEPAVGVHWRCASPDAPEPLPDVPLRRRAA